MHGYEILLRQEKSYEDGGEGDTREASENGEEGKLWLRESGGLENAIGEKGRTTRRQIKREKNTQTIYHYVGCARCRKKVILEKKETII